MKKQTKTALIKTLIICAMFAIIALAVYLPLKLTGALNKISNAEDLKQIIANSGAYGYLIFFAIQFLQVSFLPIPAFITTVAGTYVFGPLIAFIISFVSVMVASLFSFWLGRRFGERLIKWIAGDATVEKWQAKLDRGKYVYFLMMLFPVFPDDILCLIVGAGTNISYKFFIITNLITRPIGIATTCFLGSGYLIPFSGWGIYVWIVLILIGAVLFYLSFKYQPQIENFVISLGSKIKPNKNNNIDNSNTNNSTNTSDTNIDSNT